MRFVYLAASVISLAALFPNVGSAQGLQFIPITPCRVADTRNANGPFGGPEMATNETRNFAVPASACNIPTSAAAYALNVTVVPDGQLSYLTMWPMGQNQPFVSTLNSDGRVKANAAIVPAGSGGVSVFVTNPTQVIIDINGYFVPDGAAGALQFFPVTPCRVADTRSPNGSFGGPFIPAGGTRQFNITSSSCNIPTGASAFSLNFTAVPHGPLGYITVWPSDQNQPLASTLNASTGAVTANAAIVPGAAGSGGVSVFAYNDTDLVIDINGYFAPPNPNGGGLDLFNLTPCRVLDTRNNGGVFNGTIPVHVGASNCGAAGNAQAFVVNATVVPPGPLGWLTLWPDGQQQPFVSTLNASDGAITSNMAIVPTQNGSIDAFASDPTQLIVDISGYFAPNINTPPPPVNPCSGPPCAFIDSASVGNQLEAFVNINMSPAPSANTQVTVYTDHPELLAISGSASEVGGSTFTYTQMAGTSNIAILVQGLANAGTAHIWAVSGDTTYGSSVGTVNLFPSGFVLYSPSGGPGGNYQLGEFGSATFTVSSARLDAAGNFSAIQPVRGLNVNGNPPASVPTVSLSVDGSVGSASPSSLAFTGGTQSMSTQFTASGNANAVGPLIANEPPGFSLPANGANQVNITVNTPQLFCTNNVAVGANLATQAFCALSTGVAPVDETITLTSNSPGSLLLSPNLLTPGAGSIQVTMRQGTFSTAPFYLVGVAGSGTATVNATSPLGNFSSGVTLLRSGFVLSGAAGIGGTFPATFPGPDSLIAITPVSLDGSGSPLAAGQLAPGITASVNVTSSNTSVGTILGSPVTFQGGDTSGVVTFHPTGAGTSNITASASGFTTPASGASVGAIVGVPTILVTPPAMPVGFNLEVQTSAILSAPTAGGVTVTLTASGPIKLSANGTDTGATTLNINVPANQQAFLFYIYGTASAGTANITATASGFNNGTAGVTVGPSAFVITGPLGAAPVFQTSLASGPQQLTVVPAVLDSSNNFIATEGLAGSKGPVSVTITNSNTAAGTIPAAVTVPVATSGAALFTPAQSGQQTVITLGQPSGFNPPAPSGFTPGGSLTVFVQ